MTPLLTEEDTSVVVFGSAARGEVTTGSDIDWTLLIDGQASPRHFDVAREITRRIEKLEAKKPGPEGTFGGLAFSHEILHRIGGGEDTNRNLTQRILLLLESEAIGPPEAHARVLRGVLHRYIGEDAGWAAKSVTVPRFLLNDVARYWRTVAVDFAYKRRERAAEGWALRTVKLRLSRKLTYASGLLACFSCARQAEFADGDRSPAVIDHLLVLVRMTPLDRLVQLLRDVGLSGPAVRVCESYERFLRLLDDPVQRKHLDTLVPEAAEKDEVYQGARSIGTEFQNALNEVFFTDNGTDIPSLTRKYGVF